MNGVIGMTRLASLALCRLLGQKEADHQVCCDKVCGKGSEGKDYTRGSHLDRIKHPNCLHFFNIVSETRNHIWLVLEYCKMGDLLRVLKDDRHLPSSALKALGVDLLSGLHYLHSHGILYCDLKPSNVLIDEYGVLKLCDFGLARKDSAEHGEQGKKAWNAMLYGARALYRRWSLQHCI